MQKLQARLHAELSPRDKESPWQCSYALANMYRDGSEATGAHAGSYHSQFLKVQVMMEYNYFPVVERSATAIRLGWPWGAHRVLAFMHFQTAESSISIVFLQDWCMWLRHRTGANLSVTSRRQYQQAEGSINKN